MASVAVSELRVKTTRGEATVRMHEALGTGWSSGKDAEGYREEGVRREACSLADSPALTRPTTDSPKVLLLRNVYIAILVITV